MSHTLLRRTEPMTGPRVVTERVSAAAVAMLRRVVTNGPASMAKMDEYAIAGSLFRWGKDRFARRRARASVEPRKMNPRTLSRGLASFVVPAVAGWYRRTKSHPACKTFPALRIAVIDKLRLYEVQTE